MGKTYVSHTMGSRKPRGQKQALIAGMRTKAVPPSNREIKQWTSSMRIPFHVATRMLNKGIGRTETIDKISAKFNLTTAKSMELVDFLLNSNHIENNS